MKKDEARHLNDPMRELLANLKSQEASLKASIAQLEAQLERQGRGRRRGAAPLPDAPAEVAPPPRVVELPEKIQLALMRESLNEVQLAKTVGEPLEKVRDAIKTLRAKDKLFNVGLGENPTWTWKIGDDCSTGEIHNLVVRLITERPMSTRELTAAIGARMSRVAGVMVALQRSNLNIVDLGHGHAGRWMLLDENTPRAPGMRDARIAKRKPPKQLVPRR